MDTQSYVRSAQLSADAETAFAWHARPGALQRLMPPWERAEVVAGSHGLAPGSRVVLRMRLGPLRVTWEAEHGELIPGQRFTDRQVRGPFAVWEHCHELRGRGPNGCVLEDRILYKLPFGAVGRWLGDAAVRSRLDRLFDYRHETTEKDLRAHAAAREKAMRVVISGATGLVGSHLAPFLTTGGHDVVRLVRTRAPRDRKSEIAWDPLAGTMDGAGLSGADAVVHLAGESIADGRWTEARKRRIRESRVAGTRLLCESLAGLDRKPKVLVAASAIGFYGSRGDASLTEDAGPGEGFLSEVCRAWEDATEPARAAGIRVVNLRIGIVLSPRGGALARMLLPFRMGAGGVIGDGRQHMSWIAIDDLIGVIHHALNDESLRGPVNAVAPRAVTNREFTRTLGKVLSRPTILPMPGFAARLAFGEMAEALLLSSSRVVPRELTRSGYDYRYPELEGALRHLLGRTG